jgi:hypothetical protein
MLLLDKVLVAVVEVRGKYRRVQSRQPAWRKVDQVEGSQPRHPRRPEPESPARPFWRFVAPVALLAFVTGLSLISATGAEAVSYYYPNPWNGKRVFLSPAYHGTTPGARGECSGEVERYMNRDIAREAGYRGYRPNNWVLTERGYRVAIGWAGPTQNKNDSNAWGADIHVPLHSNAKSGGCGASSTSNAGTVVIYVSSAGSSLSSWMRDNVGKATGIYGSPSPGTNDYKCHVTSSCTPYSSLTELNYTTAVASYLESEYHTWVTGVNWLNATDWQSRIGWAIDVYLGYP